MCFLNLFYGCMAPLQLTIFWYKNNKKMKISIKNALFILTLSCSLIHNNLISVCSYNACVLTSTWCQLWGQCSVRFFLCCSMVGGWMRCLSWGSFRGDFLFACVLWDESRWGNAAVKRKSWRAMVRFDPEIPHPVTQRAPEPLKWIRGTTTSTTADVAMYFTLMVPFVKL